MFSNLFLEYEKTECKKIESIFSSKENNNGYCIYGTVIGKVRENDPETMRVIKKINDSFPDDLIKQIILDSLLLSPDYQKLDSIKKNSQLDSIEESRLCDLTQKMDDLKRLSCDEWIEKYSEGLILLAPFQKKSDFRGLVCLSYAYEGYYHKREKPFVSEQKDIKILYDGYFSKSSQFGKYGLVPLGNGIEMVCISPPRIFDCNKNKTLFIKNMPLYLCERIQQLIEDNSITDIAVRLKNSCIFEGKILMAPLLEEIERGKVFSLSNLGIPQITKLYSKNYGDCLWIIIKENDITFEELCEKSVVYEDKVITQVVHLEYQKSEKGIFITHLDHEYIFYSKDEFKERCKNPKQKGTEETRIKSFKIDNSHIPFDLKYEVVLEDAEGNKVPPVSVPFICFVLDAYFQHKDLLLEYFGSLLNTVDEK